MELVKGFEVVIEFLDNWKKETFNWYVEQKGKYLEAKEDRKNNPSEANQLYHYNGEGRTEKIEAFLDTKFERKEGEKMWKVPCKKTYYSREGYEYQCSYNALVRIMNEESDKFNEAWSHVRQFYAKTGGKYKEYEDVVEAVLQKEYERKYTKLVNDCQSITGEIEKADLRISYNSGNIEGFIYGKKGNAEIWSTLSGGEIQRLHFRFYCHKR